MYILRVGTIAMQTYLDYKSWKTADTFQSAMVRFGWPFQTHASRVDKKYQTELCKKQDSQTKPIYYM